jgi:hypothetical protein
VSSGILIKSIHHISLASSRDINVELWHKGALLTSGKIESYTHRTITVNNMIYIAALCEILVV